MPRYFLTPPKQWEHMSGEVREQYLNILKRHITVLVARSRRAKVLLHINSEFGGSIAQAIGFYDWVRSNRIPLVTVAEGEVASSALYLFLAGVERYITENCQIFLHRHQWGPSANPLTLPELKAELEAMVHQEKCGIRIIQQATGLSAKKILALMDRPKYFRPAEAVECGLAQAVRSNLPQAAKLVVLKPHLAVKN